jgi:hypothetical protein
MQSRTSFSSRNVLPVLLLAMLVGSGTACMSSVTGGVDKVVVQADRSDPVRAAVADALAVATQNFVPILGAPFNEEERAAMVEVQLGYSGVMSEMTSSMAGLRHAEHASESARHVTVQMPGATAKYWEQDILMGNVSGTNKYVEWTFPVPFADRHQVAMDLNARIAPLFAADPKWHHTALNDKKLNPISASWSYFLYLSMGMSGNSESIMVSVDYFHESAAYEANKGVLVYVSKISSSVK